MQLISLGVSSRRQSSVVGRYICAMTPAKPPSERPFVDRDYTTLELPDLAQRDYRISADRWVEAPEVLRALGDELGEPVEYKRRIHGWLLWRAGPPVGEARYMAVSPDATITFRFDLHGKRGQGVGPDDQVHERFRTWKEALRDHPMVQDDRSLDE